MQILLLLFVLLFTFVAGLGFAPAKELPEKIKGAGQFAAITTALAGVAWLVYLRTL